MQMKIRVIFIFTPKQKLLKIPVLAINPPLANRPDLFATMSNVFSVDLKSELLLFQQQITKDYLLKIPGKML